MQVLIFTICNHVVDGNVLTESALLILVNVVELGAHAFFVR